MPTEITLNTNCVLPVFYLLFYGNFIDTQIYMHTACTQHNAVAILSVIEYDRAVIGARNCESERNRLPLRGTTIKISRAAARDGCGAVKVMLLMCDPQCEPETEPVS